MSKMRMKLAFTLAFYTDFFVFFTGVHCCILTLKGVQMASPSREFFH